VVDIFCVKWSFVLLLIALPSLTFSGIIRYICYSKKTMHTVTLPTLEETKKQIDTYLASYSTRRIEDAKRIGSSYTRLRSAVDTLVRVGGKRLRPYIVLLSFHAYAPDEAPEDIMPAAAAQELIHLAMLIHDDIIDRDIVRYGVLNVEGYYHKYYSSHIPHELERQHQARGAALLAGDALIADAHQVMRATNRPHAFVQQAEDILSNSIFEVIGGELLDMEGGILSKGAIDPVVVAEYKTSSYSFVGPLTTGAVLAGAPEEDIILLREVGMHLGIAYQLKDDFLGTFGDGLKTGKSTRTDIEEGKYTFMVQQFEQLADESQKTEFFAIFHREHVTDEEIARARLLLLESGATKVVEDRIAHHRGECEARITQLKMGKAHKESLYSLVKLCLERES